MKHVRVRPITVMHGVVSRLFGINKYDTKAIYQGKCKNHVPVLKVKNTVRT